MTLTIPEILIYSVVGILVVIAFLAVLAIAVTLISKAIRSMTDKAATKEAPAAAPVAAPAPEGKLSPAKFDDETVAVITAAIAAVRGEGYPFQIKRIVRVKQ